MNNENIQEDINLEKATLNGQFLKTKFSGRVQGLPASDSNNAWSSMVHEDLVNAFSMLDLHLALIYEQVYEMAFVPSEGNETEDLTAPSIFRLNDYNQQKAKSCNCIGFTITGANEGVQLLGGIYLSTDKFLNLSGINVKWSENQYKYQSSLAQAIEKCKYEIKEFLFNEKYGFIEDAEDDEPKDALKQLNIFDKNDDGTNKIDLIVNGKVINSEPKAKKTKKGVKISEDTTDQDF